MLFYLGVREPIDSLSPLRTVQLCLKEDSFFSSRRGWEVGRRYPSDEVSVTVRNFTVLVTDLKLGVPQTESVLGTLSYGGDVV